MGLATSTNFEINEESVLMSEIQPHNKIAAYQRIHVSAENGYSINNLSERSIGISPFLVVGQTEQETHLPNTL